MTMYLKLYKKVEFLHRNVIPGVGAFEKGEQYDFALDTADFLIENGAAKAVLESTEPRLRDADGNPL